MSKSFLAIAAASIMFAGLSVASAQTSTTTTTSEWTSDQGKTFSEYSKTKNYSSVNDPKMNPTVGMELPSTITLYPLPDTMKVQSADKYRYGIINDHPVVVESTTRKVVHSWE
jgi:archaellum component FlaG (FlaF/FlaG flagellin family)